MTNEATITTKLGEVTVTATTTDHLHVSASNGGQPKRNLTVRNIPYHVSAHMFRWADGTWHLGREEQNTYERGQNLHASRTDRYNGPADLYASEPARRALTDELERAVNEWAATDEAAAVIRAGAVRWLRMDMDRDARKLAELRDAVQALEAAQRDRHAALDALEAQR